MPVSNGGIPMGRQLVKNAMDEIKKSEERFIMVKVEPVPPLFNYSSIWFGQPNEDNLRTIFNEFRHLQRDHIRLQESYNELKENIQLEKQMKWYWRKQARKDVVPLNSVKYTLHDGLMKVADSNPVEVCKNDLLNVSVRGMLKHEGYEEAIENLTQSLENEQQASNYWRNRYNNANELRGQSSSKDRDDTSQSNRLQMFSKALKRFNISSNVFNLTKPAENMVDRVRSAWHRLKNQWKLKERKGEKDTTRASVNRFRKMFSMSNVVSTPSTRDKETREKSDVLTANNEKTDEPLNIVVLQDNIIIHRIQDITQPDVDIVRVEKDSEMFHTVMPGMECKSVNATGDPTHKLKGIICRSTESNLTYIRKEENQKVSEDDVEGILVNIVIQPYGPATNENKYHNSGNCYFDYFNHEENNGIKWFKRKYEQALFLSEISKWRNSYRMKRTLEKCNLNSAEVKREKEKEIRRLIIRQEFLEWELGTLKQKMFTEKEALHEEKEKYEKLMKNLDKILQTNERIMNVWKDNEKERNRDRLGKLIQRIKKRERSKTREQIEETKGILKSYIEEELQRIDERRRVENQNQKLKKKLRRKVNFYKNVYKQSIEERTELQELYNGAKTEVNTQKLILRNLLDKIKKYRNKLRKSEKERREESVQLQSHIDATTTSHTTANQAADISERHPHNQEEDIRNLSVRFPEESFYTPKCHDQHASESEADDETNANYESDNNTYYGGINVVGSCNIDYCYFSTQHVGDESANTGHYQSFYVYSRLAEDMPLRSSASVNMETPLDPSPPRSLHPLPQNLSLEFDEDENEAEYNNNVFDSSPVLSSDADENSFQSFPESTLSKEVNDDRFIGPVIPPNLIFISEKYLDELEESDSNVIGPNPPRDSQELYEILEPNPTNDIDEEEDRDVVEVFTPTPSKKHRAEAISKTSQSTHKKRY